MRPPLRPPHGLRDYNQALEQAKAENRNILLDFTGSDWCPVCIQMEKEVFAKPQFNEYAARKLVLLRLDFPVSTKLPQPLQDQNDRLQEKYGVEGMFPTYILTDPKGRVLLRHVGIVEGGPAGFIAMIESGKG